MVTGMIVREPVSDVVTGMIVRGGARGSKLPDPGGVLLKVGVERTSERKEANAVPVEVVLALSIVLGPLNSKHMNADNC